MRFDASSNEILRQRPLYFGGKLGFSISGAYSKNDKDISDYNRNQGAFEYNYRGSPLLGVKPQNGTGGTATPTCLSTAGTAPTVNSTTNSSPLNCYWGFALPNSFKSVAGIDTNSLMFGSDPTASLSVIVRRRMDSEAAARSVC